MGNKKASILMVCLWTLAILVIFALGLGHRAAVTLKLARYQRDRLKAYSFAKAGTKKAIILLQDDRLNPQTKSFDSLSECGVNLGGRRPQEIFSQAWGEKTEGFSVGYKDSSGDFIWGMRDEESKININTPLNPEILEQIFIYRGASLEDAQRISALLKEWTVPAGGNVEKKEMIKYGPLKTPEELFLILKYFYNNEERAEEMYAKVKSLITVYGGNKVNVNTASRDVLTIVAGSLATIDEQPYAEKVVGAIIELRNSRGYFTDAANIALSFSEPYAISLFDKLKDKIVFRSDIFSIDAKGSSGIATKNITLIYDRSNEKILYWHEN
jgi:hypothetical protein